ncbi:DUF721 domain-containing protein [Naumannella huperziae]
MSEPPGPGQPAGQRRPELPEHDATGLDLARQIAGGVGAGGRRRRRRSSEATGRPAGPQLSGSRPDDRDPQPLGTTMDRLLSDRGWRVRVSVALLLARWPALVGPVNADHSAPESFEDGDLTVRADSTAWASSLRAMAPQVVAKLNAELGDGTVRRILVRGPDAPSWKHGPRSVRGRGPRDTYG